MIGIYVFIFNPVFENKVSGVFGILVFGIMAYAALKRVSWMRKWAWVTAIFSLLDGLLTLLVGHFSFGSFVLGAVFLYFARGGGSEVIHNKREFSNSSLRNYLILLLGVIGIIVAVYLYFQYMFMTQPVRRP